MSDKHTVHEPLLRFVKRGETPFKLKFSVRLIAILLALVVDALFIFFVIAQKQVLAGVSAGAVKG